MLTVYRVTKNVDPTDCCDGLWRRQKKNKWTQEFDADTESLSYWPIQLSPLAGRTIEVNEAGEADAVNV
jgi:hypothetical protein